MIDRAKPASSGYLKLIREHPLRPIKTEKENRAALEVLKRLSDKDGKDEDEIAYLKVLVMLIETFERATYVSEKVPGHEMLRYLMQEQQITQADLAEKLGVTQGNISHVLNAKQNMTVQMIEQLSAMFKISPSVFIDGDPGPYTYHPAHAGYGIVMESSDSYKPKGPKSTRKRTRASKPK